MNGFLVLFFIGLIANLWLVTSVVYYRKIYDDRNLSTIPMDAGEHSF